MPITVDPPLLRFRRTKIVATLGPASSSAEVLRSLIEAGTDVFRLNMSHGDHVTHRATYETIRRVAAQLDRPIAILGDLSGPKIRAGVFEGGGIDLENGTSVIVTVRDVRGAPGLIPSQYPGLAHDVRPGQRVLLADGNMELRVERIDGDDVHCTVVDGGRLTDKKGINLPDSEISAPSLTEKDERDAAFALELGVDYLALSFVRRAADMERLRALVDAAGARTSIVAKIEKPEALADADAIIEASDAIMVARGDLGVEIPPERVPSAQQQLIDIARRAQRPVIVATQMLESMISNARPTRAEVSDVANAIQDGADAIMLSGETAVGAHPAGAVRMMDRIARQTEAQQWEKDHFSGLHLSSIGEPPYAFWDALGNATAVLSRELLVRAVVVASESGLSGVTVAAARPAAPIVVLSPREETARRMQLAWGVVAARILEGDRVTQARAVVSELGLAEAGQTILLVAGFNADLAKSLPSVTLIRV